MWTPFAWPLFADREIVGKHAQKWNSELKLGLDANPPSAAGGVGAGILAWGSEGCNRVSGQELSEAGVK